MYMARCRSRQAPRKKKREGNPSQEAATPPSVSEKKKARDPTGKGKKGGFVSGKYSFREKSNGRPSWASGRKKGERSLKKSPSRTKGLQGRRSRTNPRESKEEKREVRDDVNTLSPASQKDVGLPALVGPTRRREKREEPSSGALEKKKGLVRGGTARPSWRQEEENSSPSFLQGQGRREEE